MSGRFSNFYCLGHVALIRTPYAVLEYVMTVGDEYNKRLLAFLHLLARFRDEDAAIYNTLASGYDNFAKVWEESISRPAIEYLLKQAAERIPAGGRILEAGCGTGLRIPEIISHFKPREVVGLDLSTAMLDMARRKRFDLPVSFCEGSLHRLPFEDESMDAVVATWAIETTGNPGHAVQECLRVLKPDGVLAYSYVQIPKSYLNGKTIIGLDFEPGMAQLGEALSGEHMPFHDCPNSDLKQFAGGVISTVILGKCCEVVSEWLPQPFEFDEFISDSC